MKASPSLVRYARLQLKRAAIRSLKVGALFLLNCALVVPFLYGHPLYAYWETAGVGLLSIAMAMLIGFCLTWISVYVAWEGYRDLKKGKQPYED